MEEDERQTDHSPYRAVFHGSTQCSRRHRAPSAERNTGPIVAVLRDVVPDTGRALEVASGTGQHASAFGKAFPGIVWQPSDPDPEARGSIAAWGAEEGLDNVLQPISLDVTRSGWETALESDLDLVVCINMIHIAPWAACEGLLAGAARLLRPGGLLYLYGPYRRGGHHTAPSNAEFDRSLRARHPEWGVRDLEEVESVAAARGFVPDRIVEMPANNLSVLFRRREMPAGLPNG